ncbi:hypothetical protein BOTBODRAFT_64052 [Botryobasidium botryosum FD-172 SS1]|uniref:7-dehydrocholesterol reductase n=1 Tax=Botryobasidium botryosum (strain FD-172 SS1) TaxID=930990 RepID=A0A067MS96_BOTB1|nr:hypothetical protein BOTBODRAFT_64052 [Botryobasidium botryosum FD-172 SS1]
MGPKHESWGHSTKVSNLDAFLMFFSLATSPISVIYTQVVCTHYQCSLSAPFFDKQFSLGAVLPQPSLKGGLIYAGWVLFQAALFTFLPGKIGYGQRTPAGHLLPYKLNGLSAWLITHVAFITGSLCFKLFPASIIADLWGPLLVAANVYGYIFSAFLYVKGHYFSSHPDDNTFSGSFFTDLFMGIELNPRFGELFDFKQFQNGRPGIIAWSLVDFSFAAAQYNKIGYVTNSMVLLCFFHCLYVIDFFYNEDCYPLTFDIAHDHFGFYLAWGGAVWLPWMYTLQAHYLLRNPVDLSTTAFTALLALGLIGYVIFRIANDQKRLARGSDGKCTIWGKPAKFIRAKYTTADGATHQSLLLISGFWGISHQFNYFGDLLISSADCLLCGFGHPLPYFYIVWMLGLLVHRVHRSETRCQAKYGRYWDEYNKVVPWKLCPYIY